MSANQDPNADDRGGMAPVRVSRHDETVRHQFVHEVGETLELIRSVSMAGSRIDDVSTEEILATCIDNLVELGETLELDLFVEAAHALRDVLRFDPFDGALVDKNIDRVQQARHHWPTLPDA
jgi:hypothetical protein